MLAALTHCVGMSVHRRGHEDWSLFLAEPKLRELLDGIYEEPDRTVIVSEVLQAITSHRADGEPLSLEAGILRVGDALDMAKGRSRIPFEKGQVSMHSLSAAAVEEVLIVDGEAKPVRIDIVMNNSSGPLSGGRTAQGEAPRLGARAARRGDRAHRHRRREAPRARVPARDLTRRGRRGTIGPALRDSLMVGRRILAPEVGVRVPVPQPRNAPRGAFPVL